MILFQYPELLMEKLFEICRENAQERGQVIDKIQKKKDNQKDKYEKITFNGDDTCELINHFINQLENKNVDENKYSMHHFVCSILFYTEGLVYDHEEMMMHNLGYTSLNNNPPCDNVKIMYNLCIEKLHELGFVINKIGWNIKYFYNKTNCCEHNNMITFYCTYKKYSCQVGFIDDGDCDPGIFGLEKIIDNETGKCYEKDVYVDLFCQNTNSQNLINRMTFLNAKNFDDYVNRRYGNYLFCVDKLKDYEKQVKKIASSDNTDDCVELGTNQLKFFVKFKNGFECAMRLYEYSGDQAYDLYLYPCRKTLIERQKEQNKDKGSFASDLDWISTTYNYNDISWITNFLCSEYVQNIGKIDQLTPEKLNSHLEKYQELINGKIGHLIDGKYYTGKDFCDNINNPKNLRDVQICATPKNIKITKSKLINVKIKINVGPNRIFKNEYLTISDNYPIEEHQITVTCFSEDENNINVNIKCFMHDSSNRFSYDHDFAQNIYDEKKDVTIRSDWKKIVPDINFVGNYNQAINYVQSYIDTISEINNAQSEEETIEF